MATSVGSSDQSAATARTGISDATSIIRSSIQGTGNLVPVLLSRRSTAVLACSKNDKISEKAAAAAAAAVGLQHSAVYTTQKGGPSSRSESSGADLFLPAYCRRLSPVNMIALSRNQPSNTQSKGEIVLTTQYLWYILQLSVLTFSKKYSLNTKSLMSSWYQVYDHAHTYVPARRTWYGRIFFVHVRG